MSLRTYRLIKFQQMPNDVYPSGRDKSYTADFCHSINASESWHDLTQTAKVKIPRNIYVEDENGNLLNLGSSSTGRAGANLYGGTASMPVFMRGDKITITTGYFYDNMDGTPEVLETNVIFAGYITKIKNHVPIEIDCEDEMWKLKQTKAPNKNFPGSKYTVQQMLAELLNGDKNNFLTPYKIVDGTNSTIKTNVGDFRTQNETVAQILERLQKDGGLYSYFRNNELRCSGVVYYPTDRQGTVLDDAGLPATVFAFQKNIISDTLEYTRKEDLDIAVKAHAEYFSTDSGMNLDGSRKSKKKRIEVLVGKNGVIPKELESTFHGSLITIPVLIPSKIEGNISDAQIEKKELAYVTQKALEYLPKFYYTGYRGDFTTFGQPYIRHGDAVIIQDKVLPERSGVYLVKHVARSDDDHGIRQKITLHLRIDQGYTIEQINAGL